MQIADGGGGSPWDIANPFSSDAMGAAVQAVTAETQKLVDAANSGGFRITSEGVEPIKKALTDLINDLSGLDEATYVLNQSPQLGSHPYGHTIAAHDKKGASQAEEGSAGYVLSQLRQLADQANKALTRASSLYSESENTALDAMKTKP
ncbi:hypothetical protein MUY14_35470 [Amycolatopsis sp. FBCC-B4732]|uniref:hypothetical protein n=1 Tax=Amycolatopsis sp. FBCC-B4732 TaxID=3079339 RepID=UPI001FF5C134|nr:hypothetical protein [Amycolatopsis sp. FBCC-B4732]UOX86995.1 hypothetical protein MUY14_35470 [Amycolatopsis sp. FBCC-B4732]